MKTLEHNCVYTITETTVSILLQKLLCLYNYMYFITGL